MQEFNVSASEKLWECSGGCGCGPEFMGIRSKIKAEDWKGALLEVFLDMETEWIYDLSGEWIEVESGGERHRHDFVKNPDIGDIVGCFEYKGRTFEGRMVVVEGSGEDELPYAEYLVEVTNVDSGAVCEPLISEFMPKCLVKVLLDSL